MQVLGIGKKKQVEQAAQGAGRVELRCQNEPRVFFALCNPSLMQIREVTDVVAQQSPTAVRGEGQFSSSDASWLSNSCVLCTA